MPGHARILPADIYSESSRKTASFEDKIMSKDKYTSINEGFFVYYPSKIFCNKQALLKIGEYHSDIPRLKLEHIESGYEF